MLALYVLIGLLVFALEFAVAFLAILARIYLAQDDNKRALSDSVLWSFDDTSDPGSKKTLDK